MLRDLGVKYVIIGHMGKKDIEVRTGIVGRIINPEIFSVSFSSQEVPVGSVIINEQGEVMGVKASRLLYENDNQFISTDTYRQASEKGILKTP
jgi:hypothetical protein